MKTRLYMPTDLEEVLTLFYDNVHTVCVHDYTQEQLDAWAPKNPDIYRWEASLNKNHTLVVEENGKIIGFGNVGETGYLDRLYVHADYLHQGIASMIVNQLEKYAKTKGIVFMNTAASVTSRAFFEAKGYTVLQEQSVERRGVRLRRYLMEKKLG
ncbi:GNAT family N-acetyltransferase [Candidatus Stoquefichus massiliensis]|uniref:GNAT family N-acetyltransferase n=1 Tax=Candidatus Stoquefichus massiliensis TaxID=1470350 RepID=UPI00047F571B|nr:GNAT family N-acetyltransferase [Candidatus Stoquefichus massiliensis]